MAKGFCNGCKFWQWVQEAPDFYGFGKFHYCTKFEEWRLEKRKQICNGQSKEPKEV